MAVLVDRSTRLIVQGITGREGSFHTAQMIAYGTAVVAGVTPGKGGADMNGIPVYDTVREAVKVTGADASVIYVPAKVASDAIYEAVDAGVKLVVCITEGVPVIDMISAYHYVKLKGARLIGPNCPGIISPGKCKVGIMPGHIHKEGRIGVVSRSGTLTYEIVSELTRAGIGQSTCIGIGGDPIIGTSFVDAVRFFEEDMETDAMIVVGEIGGTDEEEAAEYIGKHVRKPVIGFIAGRSAPPGKRMGHAGAIITGGKGKPEDKVRAFKEVGIAVANDTSEVPQLVSAALAKR
jgi:succinyl-CoA synthetase alpha subunit